MNDRLPPQDIEAEKAVIGAILLDNNAINTVVETLNEYDFYREAHRLIFKSMLALHNSHEAIDLITVVNVLRKENKLDDVGGIAYITSLNNIATAANVKYHAEIVKEKSLRRKLISTSTNIIENAYDESTEITQELDNAEKNILNITAEQNTNDYFMANDMLEDVLTGLCNSDNNNGIPTGYTDLDKLILGLHQSDFIILAARPSMGKTAFALNLVQNVTLHSKKPYVVAFFSLEMSKEQLLHRMLCAEAQIDSQALRTANLSDKDWEKLWKACDNMNKANIAIDDTPAITVLEMRSKARKIKNERGLDLIVVDYLQLMQGNKRGNGDNRQQEVSEISRSLKALARELKVPVIALSQLSRGVESRQVKRPMLSDLRESGSLEQDADIVAFLYREDYYNPETANEGVTELIIAKHRNGAIGTVNLLFRKEFTKFVNLSYL